MKEQAFTDKKAAALESDQTSKPQSVKVKSPTNIAQKVTGVESAAKSTSKRSQNEEVIFSKPSARKVDVSQRQQSVGAQTQAKAAGKVAPKRKRSVDAVTDATVAKEKERKDFASEKSSSKTTATGDVASPLNSTKNFEKQNESNVVEKISKKTVVEGKDGTKSSVNKDTNSEIVTSGAEQPLPKRKRGRPRKVTAEKQDEPKKTENSKPAKNTDISKPAKNSDKQAKARDSVSSKVDKKDEKRTADVEPHRRKSKEAHKSVDSEAHEKPVRKSVSDTEDEKTDDDARAELDKTKNTRRNSASNCAQSTADDKNISHNTLPVVESAQPEGSERAQDVVETESAQEQLDPIAEAHMQVPVHVILPLTPEDQSNSLYEKTSTSSPAREMPLTVNPVLAQSVRRISLEEAKSPGTPELDAPLSTQARADTVDMEAAPPGVAVVDESPTSSAPNFAEREMLPDLGPPQTDEAMGDAINQNQDDYDIDVTQDYSNAMDVLHETFSSRPADVMVYNDPRPPVLESEERDEADTMTSLPRVNNIEKFLISDECLEGSFELPHKKETIEFEPNEFKGHLGPAGRAAGRSVQLEQCVQCERAAQRAGKTRASPQRHLRQADGGRSPQEGLLEGERDDDACRSSARRHRRGRRQRSHHSLETGAHLSGLDLGRRRSKSIWGEDRREDV